MHRIRLASVFDITLASIILSMLLFCWIRFYTQNLALSLILSVICTFLLVFSIFLIKRRKNQQRALNSSQKDAALDASVQLRFSTPEQVLGFFLSVLEPNYTVTPKGQALLLKNAQKESTLFVPYFQNEVCTVTEISTFFAQAKECNCGRLVICCAVVDGAARNLAASVKNLNIVLLDAFATYQQVLAPANKMPAKVVDTRGAKLTFRQVMAYALSKERTKNYFLLGAILILSSFFVVFKIYYLVMGSVLLLLAAITRILPHRKNASLNNFTL